MRLREVLFVFTCSIFMIFSLAACGNDDNIEENINYYTLEAKAGETFDITLDNPGIDGGYDWTFDISNNTDDKGNVWLWITSEKIVSQGTVPISLGGSGYEEYTFKASSQASQPGYYEIRFEYGQWWKKDALPKEIVVYKVTVAE